VKINMVTTVSSSFVESYYRLWSTRDGKRQYLWMWT